MRSLLGEHFLRRFAGELKRHLQASVSEIEEYKAEADKAFAIDENAANEDLEKVVGDGEDKPNGEEPNKENEIELQK